MSDKILKELKFDITMKDQIIDGSIPPPPMNMSLPPPPPPVDRVSFRITTSQKVNGELIKIGGSKWMRGKTAAVILELFFDGKLGGTESSVGFLDTIKNKLKFKKKSKKSEIKIAGYNVKEDFLSELKSKLDERKKPKDL